MKDLNFLTIDKTVNGWIVKPFIKASPIENQVYVFTDAREMLKKVIELCLPDEQKTSGPRETIE